MAREVLLFCVECGFSQVGLEYELWLQSWCRCPKCGGATDGVAK